MLLSAVSASQLLSDKKTATLIHKLLELLGVGEAEQLQGQLSGSSNKHNNERVYYSIDAIITAIHGKKKVSFLYFDYAPNGKREYRKDKKRYYVNPLGLAYSDDKLYLICYHDSDDQIESYKAQVAHYSEAISKNPKWRFVDIYADEGMIYGEQKLKF